MSGKLAIDGGRPVRTEPFPRWPVYSGEAISRVVSVLESGRTNYWTGEEGRLFEKEAAAASGCRYGIALANGTVALELALWACGIGPGDEVIVTARSFVASASSIVMRGATPIFCDVERESQNVSAGTIASAITPRTRAVIAVHLAGWPCEMDPIMKLADRHGIMVIEDCAQAHGARYRGRPVGGFGHCAAFSFCQDKIVTAGGEGGMLTTNDERIHRRAAALKDHGKDPDLVREPHDKAGFRWLHGSIGTNWRITEMQAAIGRVSLASLEAALIRRRENASRLSAALATVPGLRIAEPPAHVEHSYYRLYAFVIPGALRSGWSRDRILAAILAEGAPCSVGSCGEIYAEKAFESLGRPAERLPVAAELADTSLAFLVHPTIGERDLRDVHAAVGKVMRKAVS